MYFTRSLKISRLSISMLGCFLMGTSVVYLRSMPFVSSARSAVDCSNASEGTAVCCSYLHMGAVDQVADHVNATFVLLRHCATEEHGQIQGYGRNLPMKESGTIYGVSRTTVSLDGSWRLCRLEPSRPPYGESD